MWIRSGRDYECGPAVLAAVDLYLCDATAKLHEVPVANRTRRREARLRSRAYGHSPSVIGVWDGRKILNPLRELPDVGRLFITLPPLRLVSFFTGGAGFVIPVGSAVIGGAIGAWIDRGWNGPRRTLVFQRP